MKSSERTGRARACFAALIGLFWLFHAAACGGQGDEPGPGGRIGPSSPDISDAEANDAESITDTNPTGDGDSNLGRSCEAPPENLGELSSDDQVDLGRAFHEQSSPNHASCASPPANAGVYWFTFTVKEDAFATIGIDVTGTSDPVVELRRAACPDLTESLFCDTTSTHRSHVEQGQTYYLLIQGPPDSVNGQFRLTMNFETSTCVPGERVCTDGLVEACADGLTTGTYTCSEGCSSSEACLADQCDTAAVVDVSTADSPTVFSGDQWAYRHQWNAEGMAGCTLYAGEPAGKTGGPEFFFRLTGHQVGDEVLFDAEGGGTSFAFYILGGCDATSCLGAGAFDDQVDNRFVWRATTDADVWVAAEVFGPPRDRPFRLEVRRLSGTQ